MDPKVSLTLVGLSYRTAPVAVREGYVVKPEDLPQCLRTLLSTPGVCEAFVLSTCNRTEAIVVGERGVDLQIALRGQIFRNAADEHVYSYTDVQALIHFFRVAAGLDSLVMGESEILGQIKRGFEVAQREKALGPTLQSLMQQALHVGKRVRTETSVGQGTLSVARVGIDLAARVFGNFQSCDALVIGAGETGLLTAKHLKDQGVRSLAFANRTLSRAQEAVTTLGGRAYGLEALSEAVSRADLIVTCVEANEFALQAAHFDTKSLRRRDRPLLVVDLSVPRAVDPDVGAIKNVLLYDLDDLAKVVHENRHGRDDAAERTAEIVVAEMHKFLSARAYAAFSPVIASMRERFDKVRDDVLDQVAGARSDPKNVQIAHELSKRLLDAALTHLKEGARHTRSEETLDREYQAFLERLR